jgi:hypothetical protein
MTNGKHTNLSYPDGSWLEGPSTAKEESVD